MKVDFDTRMEWLCWITYSNAGDKDLIKKLRKYDYQILADDFLWQDVILRHGFAGVRPWNAKAKDAAAYDHAMGNFWGMVNAMKFDNRLDVLGFDRTR